MNQRGYSQLKKPEASSIKKWKTPAQQKEDKRREKGKARLVNERNKH